MGLGARLAFAQFTWSHRQPIRPCRHEIEMGIDEKSIGGKCVGEKGGEGETGSSF